MIVYVVLRGNSEDSCSVAGVFLSKRLAEKCAGRLKLKRHTHPNHDYVDVQMHEVISSDSAGKGRFKKKP